jgi:lipase chaperone LimK
MNRSIIRRLEALEEKAPKDTGKWHTILVASDQEEEQKTAELKASPKWTEGDNLMVIRLVAVEHAEVASASLFTDK